MIPVLLHILSIARIALGFVSAGIICADLLRHPQHIWIMNAVWPLTALFGGLAERSGVTTKRRNRWAFVAAAAKQILA